jgi:predicted nucleotidyltransferase
VPVTRDEVLRILRSHKSVLKERFGIEEMALFGSFSRNEGHEESDVDLYVVGKEKYLPATREEKRQLYLKYSRALRDLRKQIAIDLIVHTGSMYRRMKELNGSFYRELREKGQILYE